MWLWDQGDVIHQMSGGATEFEDALIKHGILKAPINQKPEEPEIVYNLKDQSSDMDDSDGLDDDDFFEKYRYFMPILIVIYCFLATNDYSN